MRALVPGEQESEEVSEFQLAKEIDNYKEDSVLEGDIFFTNSSPDVIMSLLNDFCDDEKQAELLGERVICTELEAKYKAKLILESS